MSLGDTVLTLNNPTLTTLTAEWKAAGGHGLTGYELRYEAKEPTGSRGVRPPTEVRKILPFNITNAVKMYLLNCFSKDIETFRIRGITDSKI